MKTPLSTPPRPSTPIRRVAILFSGGPAPAANAVIASAASCLSRNGIEAIGILNGYSNLAEFNPKEPLQEGAAFVRLDHKSLDGIRNSQGIMIGTSRANPGKLIRKPEDLVDSKCTAPMKTTYEALLSLGVDALISIGGDDTLTTAAKFKLYQDGLPKGSKRIRVVHLPKTIDNDYEGIDFTFGYFTAVEMLAAELYNLLSDSRATGTYYIAQVMGRQAGWLAYGAAIAGESSLVIGWEDIPAEWKSTEPVTDPKTGQQRLDKQGKPLSREVFDVRPVVQRIVDTVIAREAEGNRFGVIVMAEGMAEFLPLAELRECLSESEFHALEPDTFGHFPVSQLKFTGPTEPPCRRKVRGGRQEGAEVRRPAVRLRGPLPPAHGLRRDPGEPVGRGGLSRPGRAGPRRRDGLRDRPAPSALRAVREAHHPREAPRQGQADPRRRARGRLPQAGPLPGSPRGPVGRGQ